MLVPNHQGRLLTSLRIWNIYKLVLNQRLRKPGYSGIYPTNFSAILKHTHGST